MSYKGVCFPMNAQNMIKPTTLAFLAAFSLASPSMAGDAPAVSGINGKISAEGGRSYNESVGMGIGTLSAPIGRNFGVQVDAGVGQSDQNLLWGADGQLFWRDPSIGLAGAGYVHTRRGGTDLNRYVAVGELYLNRFTIYTKAGFQNGDVGHGGVGQLKLAYYPTDDLKLTVGSELNPDRNLGLFETEYMPGFSAVPAAALYARAAVTGQGVEYGIAGVRFYFGQNKSLIKRHREDDPPDLMTSSLTNTPRPQPAVVPRAPVVAPVVAPLVVPVVAPVVNPG